MNYIQLKMTIATSTDLQPYDQIRLNLTDGMSVSDANWNSDCSLEANISVEYKCSLNDSQIIFDFYSYVSNNINLIITFTNLFAVFVSESEEFNFYVYCNDIIREEFDVN